MRRRTFISLLGGAAAAWPLTARAQAKRPLIGFLSVVLGERNVSMMNAFMQGLRDLDYIEGRDFNFVLSPDVEGALAAAFRKGLAEVGYVEGRSVAIEAKVVGK
jgi:hypothetical protein